MEVAIRAEGLTRRFDGRTAVDAVSFDVPPGEIFALLGPNGSGKTTTVRLLNGILAPDAGRSSVCGFDGAVEPERVHAIAGVMTETAACYGNLTGRDNLRFFGRMHGLADPAIGAHADALLAALDLAEAADRKVRTWSTGMKKRLALARTLLHRPRVLFLDEPTDGLDPEAARDAIRLIRDLARREGVTVFLCTHQLRYADEITTRCGFMHEGRLLAAGTVAGLAGAKGMGLELRLRGESLPALAGGIPRGDGFTAYPVADDRAAAALVARIGEAGGRIYEARQARPTLEDLYFAWLKDAPHAGGAAA